MAELWKKIGIFPIIRTRDDADKAAKASGNAFFVIAAAYGGIGAFTDPRLTLYGAVYAICACFIRFRSSRTAATVALLVSIVGFLATASKRNGNDVAGTYLLFSAIVITLGARAVDATFKLNGRFKQSSNAAEDT